MKRLIFAACLAAGPASAETVTKCDYVRLHADFVAETTDQLLKATLRTIAGMPQSESAEDILWGPEKTTRELYVALTDLRELVKSVIADSVCFDQPKP